MINKKYNLTAWIDTRRPARIQRALEDLTCRRTILATDVGFFLKATVHGSNAHDLNRTLLAGLRRIEPHTSLHAEWKSRNSTEWFFNYVQKRSRKTSCSDRLKLRQAGRARSKR